MFHQKYDLQQVIQSLISGRRNITCELPQELRLRIPEKEISNLGENTAFWPVSPPEVGYWQHQWKISQMLISNFLLLSSFVWKYQYILNVSQLIDSYECQLRNLFIKMYQDVYSKGCYLQNLDKFDQLHPI